MNRLLHQGKIPIKMTAAIQKGASIAFLLRFVDRLYTKLQFYPVALRCC